MNYYINPTVLSGVFTVPNLVVDRYFKLSDPQHIKVLLYVLRNIGNDPEESTIAEECNLSEYDVKEALLYWADAGIILPKTAPVASPDKKIAVKLNEKPSRRDIAKRSMEDSKIQYLVCEAQKRFARNLKDNETRTLVWLYDDQGVDVSVILLVIQYAIAKEKGNIRFIEKVCLDLADKGINNISDADTELHKRDLADKCWLAVCTAFGIERRKPSKKESETATMWLNDWGISKEMLSLAYDECVDKKSKFSFPYIAKIIENWHKEGYKKPEDIKGKPQKENFASYDIDLYEKMINAKE